MKWEKHLQKKMQSAKRTDGSRVYTRATGFSLLIFYLLAMQCMSTLAVVKRETGSWKWPIIQLFYMTALAYFFKLNYVSDFYLVKNIFFFQCIS